MGSYLLASLQSISLKSELIADNYCRRKMKFVGAFLLLSVFIGLVHGKCRGRVKVYDENNVYTNYWENFDSGSSLPHATSFKILGNCCWTLRVTDGDKTDEKRYRPGDEKRLSDGYVWRGTRRGCCAKHC